MKEESIEAVDGLKIFMRSWQPQGKPRGTVVINHGLKAHGGRYGWAAEQLLRKQFAVYAHDMRGHGKSDGEPLFVNKLSEYVDDLARVVTIAKEREGSVPTFVLGHSAGGVVASVYMIEHQKEVSGFVCESFAHEVPTPDFALAILKGVGAVTPHAHVFKLKDEDFSRDPKFVEQMRNDPLLSKKGYEAQTIAELVRADEHLKKEFPLITLPVFIIHGTLDHVTKPHGSQVFYDRAGSKDKTFRLYEGHYHDLLNDIDKERVMADITEWLTMRVPRA